MSSSYDAVAHAMSVRRRAVGPGLLGAVPVTAGPRKVVWGGAAAMPSSGARWRAIQRQPLRLPPKRTLLAGCRRVRTVTG